MRRMRFSVPLADDESIPGALVKGIRTNVLERTSVMFDDTGLPRRKAGFVQMMPAEELEQVARFMRCDADALIARAGTIVRRTHRSASIHFGDLRLDTGDIDFERRRIAPTTLRDHPHHREAWLFTLLPYCPVSLERLVGECTTCETALAWSRGWGIGVCEWCRKPVPPSAEPSLASQFAADYRLFADLLSPRASVRKSAMLQLPAALQELAPGSVVSMALRLGRTCRPDPLDGVRRHSLSRLGAPLLASIITTGTRLMRSWPDGFKAWARAGFERNAGDLEGHHRVRAQIKRLGNPKVEDAAQARLVREALPQEFASFVHSAASGDFVTATQFKLRTSVKQQHLELIREELEERRLPGRTRVRSQLNAARVDEFDTRYRTSLRLRRLTFQLDLPTYALEQMVCLGLLPAEQDTAVRTARHGMCVQQASVDALIEQVRDGRSRAAAPLDAIPIRAAARGMGGREKPWAAIFQALCKGQIEFWLCDDAVSSKSILVRPASLSRFQAQRFNPRDFPDFPFSTTINHNEAGEILNLTFAYMSWLIEDGHLSFEQRGTILVAPKKDVLDLARKMVSPAELGYAMGMTSRAAGREAEAMGVRRIGPGWSRRDLEDFYLVPVLGEPCAAAPEPRLRFADPSHAERV